MPWTTHDTIHLQVHSFRERIHHAWRILTTGQTKYRFTFEYRIGEDISTLYVDGKALIPIPKEGS